MSDFDQNYSGNQPNNDDSLSQYYNKNYEQHMKKTYLHMGLHKTASSSFQSTCAENIEQLSNQGYTYPAFHFSGLRNGRDFYNHSGPIFSAFTESPEAYGFNIKKKVKNLSEANKQYMSQLDKLVSLDTDLIISGEGLSGLSEDSLNNLYKYLVDSGSEVIPIVCVRSPYEFHCSSRQTVVKHGKHINFSRLKSQKETILKINRVFKDKIHFVAFKTACKHPKGPTAYMLEYCGVDTNNFTFATENVRRSNEYVRLQNAINKHQPSLINNKVNKKHFKIHEVQGNKFLLNENELELMQVKLDEENEFFRATLGGEFCDKKIEISKILTAENLVAVYPDFFFNKVNRFLYKVRNSRAINFIQNIFQK